MAVNTLENTKIVVSSPKGGTYEGTSFGLSFLIGCLASGLGIHVREGQLFSAGLSGLIEAPIVAGCGIKLQTITGIGAKLSTACLERRSRLYLRADNEEQILKFEQGFWRGEADRSCLPYILPEQLSLAAVIAVALESEKLLAKALSVEHGTSFLLLLYIIAGELSNGASLVNGIGSALAQLRGEGRLNNVMFFTDLIHDIGIENIDRTEDLLFLTYKRCLEKCANDSHRAEIVKATISRNQKLPLFLNLKDVPCDYKELNKADLDIWLDHVTCRNFFELQNILTILRTCNQIAPDFENYWFRIEQVIKGVLSTFFDTIIEYFRVGNLNLVGNSLSCFYKSQIIDSIGRLRPTLVRGANEIIDKYLGQLQKSNNEQICKIITVLRQQLKMYQLPEALIEIEQELEPVLELTFSIADQKNTIDFDKSGAIQPRPALGRINNLQLLITGPQELSLLVPSPVLLFENCRRQHYSFCRRRDMTLADDTMSRYPENDAFTAIKLFDGHHCNIIGFKTNSDHQHWLASIKWRSNLNPWPPAIDSQLLAASIVESNRDFQPCRLLDVGCGSGYLTIISATSLALFEGGAFD